MTKADIVEKFADRSGLSKKDSADMIEVLLSVLKETLETGELVKISGFGNFVVKQKHDRRGRNPHTGETLTISARRVLAFKPSKVLCDNINRNW